MKTVVCSLSVSSTEVVKTILTASLTLTSMLVGLIGFLLAQYQGKKDSPSYESRPYRDLVITMTGILYIGSLSCFLSLTYLLGVFRTESLEGVFALVLTLFIVLLISLVAGVTLTVIKTFK